MSGKNKKYFLVVISIFFVFSLWTSTVFAAGDQLRAWTALTSAGSRAWSAIVSSPDGTNLVATVNNGYIYTSVDSGITWTERTSAGSRRWSSVAESSDGKNLAATVLEGYIYTSDDFGVMWTQQTDGVPEAEWKSIAASPTASKLVALGNGVSIIKSSDSGNHWDSEASPGHLGWTAVSSDPNFNYLVAVESDGSIYTSVNSGGTWEFSTSDSRPWGSVTVSSGGTKIAVVADGSDIYTSTDFGATWTDQTASGERAWRSVTSSSDGVRIVAVVDGDYIYTSHNSGDNWLEQTSSGQRAWRSVVSSSDGEKLFAVTDGGYIYAGVSDGTDPTITSVSSDKVNNSYTIGEVIDIDVTFSEAVTSTGNVTVTLETGATDRTCTFTVTSSTTGTCNYTVQVGDSSSDLTVSSISGTIKDSALRTMTNFVPTTNLAANKALVIDTTGPIISNTTSSNIISTGATITWTTNEMSSSIVEYGTTGSYGSSTTEIDTPTGVISHSVTLLGLSTCTTYHYRVKSKDTALNFGTGIDNTFTTKGCRGGGAIIIQPISSPVLSLPTVVPVVSTPTSVFLKKILSFGSANEQVVALQNFLKKLGIFTGRVDGIFGRVTKRAVVVFQKFHNIKPDGIVGPITGSFINP